MKKLLKIFLILVISLAFFVNVSVLAVENTNTTNTSNTNSIATTSSETQKNDSQPNSNNSTQVSSISPTNDGELSVSDILSDILNILLIATGVVIILLAIAILIRLK